MILFVSKAHPSIERLHAAHPNVGRLAIPRDCGRIAETAAAGIPWAADNAAFSDFDPVAYLRMLDALAGLDGCRFVTVPDAVGDARATARLFDIWAPAVERRGLPVALVLQDGLGDLGDWLAFQWHRLDAVFVGGTTGFKMGAEAATLVQEAKRRGLWAHMGRVNTGQRIRYAKAIGCDSVDGSKWSRWTDTYIADGQADVAAPVQEILAL